VAEQDLHDVERQAAGQGIGRESGKVGSFL
jgi:hypothetical protein